MVTEIIPMVGDTWVSANRDHRVEITKAPYREHNGKLAVTVYPPVPIDDAKPCGSFTSRVFLGDFLSRFSLLSRPDS